VVGESDLGPTFSVRDDGIGFDAEGAVRGQGLANMADRLASVGGTLSIDSAPGRGSRITGRVPVEAAAATR
jgi:signal transduction histidine kinase